MPRFPAPNPVLVIHLSEEHRPPPEAHWARIERTGRGADLTGSLPSDALLPWCGQYRSAIEAEDAAVRAAMAAGVGELFVEGH